MVGMLFFIADIPMKLSRFKRAILSVLLIILPISSSLCIDMYLPAYGSIAKTFGVHESAVNLSMRASICWGWL